MALSDDDKRAFASAAHDVALFAGARVRNWERRRAQLQIEEKNPHDPVSQVDRLTEQLIVAELRQRFPTHAFVGEELHAVVDADATAGKPTWIIDPVDGTDNFIRGVPLYAVSIALWMDGDVQVGAIHLPHVDETFVAAKGLGATLDGVALHCSSAADLSRATVGVATSHRVDPEAYLKLHAGLVHQGAALRSLGSACVHLAYVASGRLDGYCEQHLYAWDVAAGMCILREAGAITNAFTQGAWLTQGGPFVCGAPGIYPALARLALETSLAVPR